MTAQDAYRALIERNEAAADLGKQGYALEPTPRLELAPGAVFAMTRAASGRPSDGPLIDVLLKKNERMSVHREHLARAIDELAALEEEDFVERLLDAKQPDDRPVPELARLDLDGRWHRAVASTALAMLARDRSCPRLALWHAATPVLAPSRDHATLEAARVSQVALLALFRLLKVAGIPENPEEGSLDGDTFAAALQQALDRPSLEVRAAAART